MNIKLFLFIGTSLLIIIVTWGFLTEWKFILSKDPYLNPFQIKEKILLKAEKNNRNTSNFLKEIHTIIEEDDKFNEIELKL